MGAAGRNANARKLQDSVGLETIQRSQQHIVLQLADQSQRVQNEVHRRGPKWVCWQTNLEMRMARYLVE
jgi:hypothetical protein